MAFRVAEKTLSRLEWPELVERLAGYAHTARARRRLEADGHGKALFEGDLEGVRERLAETSEARALLDAGHTPPFGGVHDLDPTLERLGKGGALEAAELLALGSTLAACRATARFLATRDAAARLAALGTGLVDLGALQARIEQTLDPEGEVRDGASPLLAEARRASRRLAAEVQRRIERCLRDPGIAPALSDSFFTVRNDRYVLPVRADARGRVPGIVHDASASGTTLFVEPEALVEVNNQLKQAELEVERETRRVLRALSMEAAGECSAIEANLATLECIDLAFARGRLSQQLDAVEPEVRDEGVLRLPQLRHPLIDPSAVVPNDLRLGEGFHVLVVSGPNAGGKTVAMKAAALAALLVRAGMHVPAAAGARLDAVDAVLADIGDEQDLRESLSTFSAHMANLSAIVRAADRRSLVVLDEVGVGTDPSEGAAIGQAVLEELAGRGARVVATTHYNLLKEMAAVDARFENASVEFDPETLAPTYRLRLGAAGSSSATAVAARMGMPNAVLERATALLDREDRQLDRMLAELSSSRAALERERSEAAALRAEGESARLEYRRKLERLQERRDALFASMRSDLDQAFRRAHAEVAAVIRELQRGGGAQQAARARERLLDLEQQALATEHEAAALAPGEPVPTPVDWQRVAPGDSVRVRGGTGVLLALPDRRGRVSVQMGATKLSVPADQVTAVAPAEPRAARVQGPPARSAPEPGALARCDLRGLRVEEALDRLAAALDAAAAAGSARLVVLHGIGTGALLRAVRGHLRESPYVAQFAAAAPEEGGDGVTLAQLLD